MPAEITIRDAALWHAREIAIGLRLADQAEVRASCGLDVDMVRVLEQSVLVSEIAKVVEINGRAVILLGCAQNSDGVGSPWLVATSEATQFPLTLTKVGREQTAAFMRRWGRLENYVAEVNQPSVKWLARLGYTIHPAAPFGALGEPFHRFTMGA